jgi:hypothetical protein
MKLGRIAFIALIILGLVTGFSFLIYKTWIVFGFWTILWTGLVSFVADALFGNLIGSRKESNGIITFNPKEWPKFINITISLGIGYYLYSIISAPTVDENDYLFGLTYLIALTCLPIIWSLYKLIRDRNDFVQIEGQILSYRDNAVTGQLDLTTVVKFSGLKDLNFELADQSTLEIKLSQMNFNTADRIALIKEIELRLPQVNEAAKESD